jgi:hypothetical protein
MSSIYELIGRLVVWHAPLIGRLVVWYVRQRYGRQIKIAGGVGLAAALAGGYLLAKREPPEG